MDRTTRHFTTLGMFIIDYFQFSDTHGRPSAKVLPPQIGGGGTYAAIGARIWLSAQNIGMIVDRGGDFPSETQLALDHFGPDMWLFRDDSNRSTTRALNRYRGDHRDFQYLNPRLRITPNDFTGTKLARSDSIHFICSPSRAAAIISQVREVEGWEPVTIYEPIPDRCVPEELPALVNVLPSISILSPNAEEAIALLSIHLPPSKPVIEDACARFLNLGVGRHGTGHVVIRCGPMGAYVASRAKPGVWVDAFWSEADPDKIVDVTGAGNSFLGGLSAGLLLADGDVFTAVHYATVSASFTIEQRGLPRLTAQSGEHGKEVWNGDDPNRRLLEVGARQRWVDGC